MLDNIGGIMVDTEGQQNARPNNFLNSRQEIGRSLDQSFLLFAKLREDIASNVFEKLGIVSVLEGVGEPDGKR